MLRLAVHLICPSYTLGYVSIRAGVFFKRFRGILTFQNNNKTFQNLMNNQEIPSFTLFKLTLVKIYIHFHVLCFLHYRGRKRFVSEGDGGRLKPESY